MTSQSVNVAETYKQITEAEKQALALERMLDDLDTKMDSILDEIKQNDKERREQLDRNSFSQDAQPSSDKNAL
ncbi:CIC11C00000000616 [Sungouiella intermedia]|uniref:CIC11C00000000616 n=1 Tax=Sungouiella intermedia TaxID=45354 RepID=A0A1L0BAM8_9ASCO|nr:CIC11C00000000616 [[Candida] intermedia]